MGRVVTPEQVKQLEKLTDESGVSYLEMMENAGRELAEVIKENLYGENGIPRKVLFLCGSGNNGGDCFVAARILSRLDILCAAALPLGRPKTDISKSNFERLKGVAVIYEHDEIVKEAQGKDLIVVDGIFGTGFHGELSENVKEIFAPYAEKVSCSLNRRANVCFIAVDVPSGGNCLTGAVSEGTPYADITVTFGCMKFGQTQYPLREYCGELGERLFVGEIGIRPNTVTEPPFISINDDVRLNIINKAPDINKGNNGRLLVICGSDTMPGACVMAVGGALRSGVGLVQVASTSFVTQMIASRYPEAMIQPLNTPEGYLTEDNLDEIVRLSQNATAVLIGCGMGTADGTKALIKKLIKNISCPKIIDADGINCITDSIDIIKDKADEIVLTPHPGEMGRLLGKTAREVQSDRLNAVCGLVKETGAVVALKGAGTLIAYKDTVRVNQTGNSGMAKGGSGDVLAGIIASLTAQGMPLQNSASAGVYLHGLSGDIAAERYTRQCMTATDIIECLPEAFKSAGIE